MAKFNQYNGFIEELDENEVFVFGSNLAGRHGGGAALKALYFGAVNQVSVGICGQTYAIPTLDENYKKLPLPVIKIYLEQFAEYARVFSGMKFYLTPIGTGIAGFSKEEIESIMPVLPSNVVTL